MKKILITIFILSYFHIFILVSSVYALSITEQSDLSLDTSITRIDTNYNIPTKIVVVPINPPVSLTLDEDDLYKGLYYYTVDKLGFNDIPFHYVVSTNGEIYKGNLGGEERKIKIEGIGDDILVVGYMNPKVSNSNDQFSEKGKKSLIELLNDLCNKNSIHPTNISLSAVRFIRNQSTRSVSLTKGDAIGKWNIDEVKLGISYAPQPKTYKLEVVSIKALSENPLPGESVDVEITLKNTHNSGFYGGTNSSIVLTSGSSQSSFYLNNEWLSQTQVGVMEDDEILLPGQEAVFLFKVRAPLYIGEKSEQFELTTLGGARVEASKIDLKLNLATTDKRIVEVLDSVNSIGGVLAIRDDANSFANIIGSATAGQRYFQLEDAGNGFVKIETSTGEGWVLRNYLRVIE